MSDAERVAPLPGRRRPSGEPPPLPRPVSRTTRVYVALVAAVALLWIGLLTDSVTQAVTDGDVAVLNGLAHLRAGPLTTVMEHLHALGSEWTFRVLVWPTLIVLVVARRFQRLVVFLAILNVVVAIDAAVNVGIGRMRPSGPEMIGAWSGYAQPSLPVATLGLGVVGVLYTLVPAGPWRNRLAAAGVGVVALLAVARLYLAVDHPTDVLAGAVTGMALPVVAFRLLVPDEADPVRYGGGRRAHLDVGGTRGQAILTGLRTQVGLDAVRVEPFALKGSAGSTPLRLVVRGRDGSERLLFGKLYATVHLRSDRWYKIGRTVMYGRLEDERSFNTVRRLVEYEDHMLRVTRDAGLPTAEPYGFVEITPEREYLLVTEFIDRATPLSREVVDDRVIDDALAVVQRMWRAGLAHRDIKPANLLVRDGRVVLIDLAFAAVRPTPWRQAVDLANMMVTLALFSTPERVYERAVSIFRPEDVSEAFAASRGATIPSQLRTLVREDGRHVATRLRELAPPRPPVSIQRWTLRRVALTLGLVLALAVGAALLLANLQLAGLL